MMILFSRGVTKDLSEQILGMINNASALLKARQVVAPQPPANMGPPTQSTPKSNLSQALPGLPSSVANLVNLPPVPVSFRTYNIINPLTAKLFIQNFHPLEAWTADAF